MNIKKIIWRFVGPIFLILISFIFEFLGNVIIAGIAAFFGIFVFAISSTMD